MNPPDQNDAAFVEPEMLLRQRYDVELALLENRFAEATSWWQRRVIRWRMRMLRRAAFGTFTARW